jgi:hypothetical protein
MAKRRKPSTEALKENRSANFLLIEETDFLRPNWSRIVKHMISARQDVKLRLLRVGGDVGLYKALRRAGYWAYTHRISETEVVYRLSEKPPLEHEGDLLTPKNPLPEEYAPEVPKKKYGRYRILASKLASGESVVVHDEKEAVRLRSTMRRLYPVVSDVGTPSHPPHRIESRENPVTGEITLKCYWERLSA